MGFIWAFLTLDPGFNTSDLTNCYYIIDGLKYEPETVGGVTNENIIVSITFNIYPTYNDRVLRQNLIGDILFNKINIRLGSILFPRNFGNCRWWIVHKSSIKISYWTKFVFFRTWNLVRFVKLDINIIQ